MNDENMADNHFELRWIRVSKETMPYESGRYLIVIQPEWRVHPASCGVCMWNWYPVAFNWTDELHFEQPWDRAVYWRALPVIPNDVAKRNEELKQEFDQECAKRAKAKYFESRGWKQ